MSNESAEAAAHRVSRSYPDRPIVTVGGVIVHDGRIVLVRRRFEPAAGRWSLPGGMLEVGEALETAVAREMLEETGLVVEVGPVAEVLERIVHDADHRVQYHYVLIDYVCRPVAGELRAGSDADGAAWVHPDEFDRYGLSEKARAVIGRALTVQFRKAEGRTQKVE